MTTRRALIAALSTAILASAIISPAGAAVVAPNGLGSSTAGPSASRPGTFCAPRKPVRDFGLSKLPPLHEAPESATGLGRGAVSIYGGWTRVMPEPSSFGYGFSEHNYGGTVLLDWTVTAQLSTVDRRGELLEQVDSDRLSIGRLDAAHQPHIEVEPPPDRRGFYRYDMQIANAAGRVLGSYGAYFKVVAPSWRPKLQLSRDTVYPGQQIQVRLASFGSETVAYAEPFGMMRFEDGQWALASDLTADRWLKWLGFISPGLTGRCNRLVLPSGTPPGRYRVVKVVGTQLWPEGRRTRVVADFHVIEPGADIEYRPKRDRWFQALVDQGETDGYAWAAGVKGPKFKPLNELCAQISILEPVREDVPFVEGSDSTECGHLNDPSSTVVSVESFGSDTIGGSVLEALFRPTIRKVTLVASTGERLLYRTLAPDLPDRAARGIPLFRYIVAPFEGDVCIRRIVAYDRQGRTVSSQPFCEERSK